MQNRFDELFALLHLLVPGALGPSAKSFETAFGRPIKLGQRRGASQADAAAGDGARRALRARLEPVMLRRNKSVIATSMPRLVHHVVFVELADVQVGELFSGGLDSHCCRPFGSLLKLTNGIEIDEWIIDTLQIAIYYLFRLLKTGNVAPPVSGRRLPAATSAAFSSRPFLLPRWPRTGAYSRCPTSTCSSAPTSPAPAARSTTSHTRATKSASAPATARSASARASGARRASRAASSGRATTSASATTRSIL